ncbi:unnamed protein product [Strongylus vulgaris]|uniref:C2H2-type domain-containing protein n=1 Tax=Strongylus vulgaris TaxID=40348 RepID=A0A3P7J951_STRVU|nr:unnamed protein product [Strongylus vulgaris]
MDQSRDETKRLRDEDFDELMAACDTAKNAVKNENSLSRTLERLKMDNDPLLEGETDPIHAAKELGDSAPYSAAPPTDNLSTHSATNIDIRSTPKPLTNPSSSLSTNTTSNTNSNPSSNPGPEMTARALDKLDSSVESEDPLTVVEKDDNGFVFYKCRFCGLTFNYMNTLRAHERVHNISQGFT